MQPASPHREMNGMVLQCPLNISETAWRVTPTATASDSE